MYSLYDDHVAKLVDRAVYHIEHLRMGLHDEPTAAVAQPAVATRCQAREEGPPVAADRLDQKV